MQSYAAFESLRQRNITTPKAAKRWDETRGMHGLYAQAAIAPGELVWISFLFPEDCDFFSWADIERNRALISYAYQIDTDLFSHTRDVDADISNYFNHACDANCWYDHSEAVRERFLVEYAASRDILDNEIEFVVAARPIAAGEELTMDYSSFWTVSDLEFECRCGSDRCRRIIKKDDYQLLDPQHCSLHVKRRSERFEERDQVVDLRGR